MTIRTAAIALALASSLAGCAEWVNPELSDREAQKAAYGCERDMRQERNPFTGAIAYSDCMRANGFVGRWK
jgi:hypothetical protein